MNVEYIYTLLYFLISILYNYIYVCIHIGILTATVIECKRAKLNASCYEYAVQLMSQYRMKIQPEEIRKTIEGK